MIYTLDTSVLVDALRQPTELEYLKEFLNWALPQTALSSVVASELLAGARTAAARRLVDGEFLGAFARRGRIVAPSTAAWVKTGISLGQSGGGSCFHRMICCLRIRRVSWAGPSSRETRTSPAFATR
jgi:hypothetical protein